MTYEEKKVWLNRYREEKQKEQKLFNQLAEAREAARHTTQALSPVSGGAGDGQSLARAVERCEALEQQLQARHALCTRLYGEILDVLQENIRDEMDYVLLHRRYLECMTWAKIADDLHYTQRWVYLRHRNLVERLML